MWGVVLTPPSKVLWELQKHSIGKHQILRKYLDRWLPIMARTAAGREELLLVDGFAGPGIYKGGEDGSPIIMLRAFLEHSDRAAIERTRLRYVFIESHRGRFESLLTQIDRLGTMPENVRIIPIAGEYGDVMGPLLEKTSERVPTFAFLDPFGYSDTELSLTSGILGFPRCEVLIYHPSRQIARFLEHPDAARSLDLLYGGREWEECIDVEGNRPRCLRELFGRALSRSATHIRTFEIITGSGGGYDLFFGTNNRTGLKKMKEAMWKVDPVNGRAYRHVPEKPQTTMFEPEADTMPLRAALRERFGTEPFTVAQAEEFTALETDFVEDMHLKMKTLAPLEWEGRLTVIRPRGARKGSWPAEVELRFVT